MTNPWGGPRLAGLAEVAGLAGVTRKRAWQLTRHPKFPEPVQELAATPVWREDDVQAWLATPRPPGRPKTTPANEHPARAPRSIREVIDSAFAVPPPA